jgi:HD-like signal output (HDOD) protein
MSYAMQQVRDEPTLRSIAVPLSDLWNRSIAVACICRLLAPRTKVPPDEAFLTGLLHGIGMLYIMVRAVTGSLSIAYGQAWVELITGWHAPIGKTILESWGFVEPMCDAVGDQSDFERRWKHSATLTDILIAGIVLADALPLPEPRTIGRQGLNAFMSIGVTPAACNDVLAEAESQIRLVHEALA